MRLIDADAFEKFIKEKYEDGESTDDIKDQFLFDLSYQPTSYDVEKVVQELENSTVCGMFGAMFGKSDTEIIDIIKAGGVK